jgi:hypothetical protein
LCGAQKSDRRDLQRLRARPHKTNVSPMAGEGKKTATIPPHFTCVNSHEIVPARAASLSTL